MTICHLKAEKAENVWGLRAGENARPPKLGHIPKAAIG
jgi:hypothetical protein